MGIKVLLDGLAEATKALPVVGVCVECRFHGSPSIRPRLQLAARRILCCLTSYKPSCSRLSISSSSAAAIGAKQVYLSEMLPWPSMHTPPRPRDGSTTKIDPVSPLSSSREFTLLMRTWVGTDGKLIEGAGLLAPTGGVRRDILVNDSAWNGCMSSRSRRPPSPPPS